MAGAFGTIEHIHEDYKLTFGDIKQLLNDFDKSKIDVYEKYDGQNLMVTFKDNLVKCARNKSSLVKPMSVFELEVFFKDKEFIQKSFTEAMLEIESHLEHFEISQLNEFFKDGQVFLNLEIINPVTRNVIDYGDEFNVIVTGAVVTDGLGNKISHLELDTLDWLFIDTNSKISKFTKLNYTINVTDDISAINNLMELYNLNDSNSMHDVITVHLNDVISTIKLTDIQRKNLQNRWINNDKHLKLSHTNYGMSFSDIKIYEVFNYDIEIYELTKDYRNIIQRFGNKLLKAIALTNDRMTDITPVIDLYVSCLEQAERVNAININKHLTAINQIGLDNIVNCEGIVFNFKNKLYKFVGIFQHVNQICGIVRYGK